jgi:ABC-type transport system, involved in lipoprotein release, permease component
MTTSTRKALRDFWQERTRTILVVLAIALGIAAFSSVMSSFAILTRELDRGYLNTNPASAIFRMDAIDDDLVNAVLSDRSISDAEPRRVVSGQIKSGPIQWRNLVLFVVKDYGNVRVSKLEHEQGSWPPAKGELLIERDAFQVAHTRVGDVVTVKTANGVENQLVVSGSVHDVGQAQARMENAVYGYITLDTLELLGEKPYLDQLNILVAESRFDENHIRDVTSNVRKIIEDRGHQIRRVDIPTPGKHPHSEIMGALLLSMSSFGLFVLALSGILVVNLLTSIMAAQVRQIGIMKAVGGSRWQVARIYFGQAILLGATATLIALPLGLIGSRALCRYMSVFLNFDINSFAVPLWVYLLVALVGIVTPLLAAAFPIWKGTRVPVRVAISDYGVSQGRFGTNVLDRLMAGISGRYRPLVMSLRNSFRRRARLVLTLLTLSAGGLFFMSALNIRASMINTLDRLFGARKFDLSVAFSNPQPVEKIRAAVSKTTGVTWSEEWFGTEASMADTPSVRPGNDPHSSSATSLHGGGESEDRFSVVALPVDTKLLTPDIIEGRMLMPGDVDAIVINTALARKSPMMRVGNTVKLRTGPAETNWSVVGISRETFSPPVAYIPLSFVQQRHPGMANNVRLALAKTDSDSIDLFKLQLDRDLESEGIRARTAVSTADSRFAFDQHMFMIYVFLIVTSLIIGGIGTLGLMTTMSVNVLERRREMGVLRAIGATPRMIAMIVLMEATSIGFLSWLIAAVAAWPIGKVVGDAIVGMLFKDGMDFVFEPIGLLVWLLASIVFSAAATLFPAWRASKSTVSESLAYQ